MFLCVTELTEHPEDDGGGPNRTAAAFLWRGCCSGLRGRDGGVLQSSSPDESQV